MIIAISSELVVDNFIMMSLEQRTPLGPNEQPFLGLSGSCEATKKRYSKIICSICSTRFTNFFSLKRHSSRFHPTHPLPVRGKNKAFPCQHCHKKFSEERNLKRHIKKAHDVSEKYELCFFCSIKIENKEFKKHLSQEHNFNIQEEKLEDFPNFNKFVEWKKHMEIETSSKFNLRCTVKKSNIKYYYFHCYRSGHYISKSQGKRAPKAKGSCKIGNKCPAKLKVTQVDNGICTVVFTKSHLGHSTDLRHIPLSSSKRETIVAKKAQKLKAHDFTPFKMQFGESNPSYEIIDFRESNPFYEINDFEEALKLENYTHAAHCVIFSQNPTELFDDYKSSALISMQMRFDGSLGFHGGIIDEGTDILTGLNRKLIEEINLKTIFHVTHKDHMFTHVASLKKSCYHFYAKEVSKEEFQSIEYDILSADKYGFKTFGLVRVPMFIMHDHIQGLPTFLKNQFAGCAKLQLLNFLVLKELCSFEELNVYLSKS